MKHLISENDLFAVALPEATSSYKPVSHKDFTDALKEELYRKNLNISNSRYTANGDGTQMFGVYELETPGGNGETLMNIGFRNSYDKSLAVGLVAGGTVIVCSNLMFKGDIKVVRKHTTGVYTDMKAIITQAIDLALPNYESLNSDMELWKNDPMSKRVMAELAGRMFIEEQLITGEQLKIMRDEIHLSNNFVHETKWDFYNHITEALKRSHPKEIMSRHTSVHKFLETV